ncbi:MAG: LamG domain-containing protein [Phycisphaerae bacterium]|nr:LamG domain-containing protein [Phycisphaerae bacterium]
MKLHRVQTAIGVLLCLVAVCASTFGYSGGSGTAESPFVISSSADWKELTLTAADWAGHLILIADIDLEGGAASPIGSQQTPFTGFVDGNGHVIRNVVINQPTRTAVGLFGCLGKGSMILELGVDNIQILGRHYVGGIAGENSGRIDSCFVSGTVKGSGLDIGGLVGSNSGAIVSSYSTVSVTGSEHVGGLAGWNGEGSITSSYASGSVTGYYHIGGLVGGNIGTIYSSFATGPIRGNAYSIGGLVGVNSGTIHSCYSSGTIFGSGSGVGGLVGWNSDTILSSYATGSIAGSYRVGGLVGESFQGTTTQSFWDVETTGLAISEGGEGKTTAEMKKIATYTSAGWDFFGGPTDGPHKEWRMCSNGYAYPRLVWEFSRGGDFVCPDGVDVEDLMQLAESWLAADPNIVAGSDANGDHQVGLEDLAILSGSWLNGNLAFPRGRVAYWAMDDNAADTVVAETGGDGFDGSARRNTETMATEGRIGGALEFDGAGDWIDCGTDVKLFPEAWTVCAWVKCMDTATPTLISFGGSYPAVKLQQNDKGRPLIYLGQYNYRYFNAGAWTTLKDGQWHHVAFVVPGSQAEDITLATMYLDGQSVAAGATRSDGPQAAKTRLLIGINSATGQQRFAGAMDEVMLFNRALTEEEVQTLFGL